MKLFTTLISAVLLSVSLNVFAEETTAPESSSPWKLEGIARSDISRSNFKNWSAGGEDMVVWQMLFDSKAIYEQNQNLLENSLRLGYGRTSIGNDHSRKSLDEIKFQSSYTYKTGVYVDPYASFLAETQFTKGYEYFDTLPRQQVSDFWDPGKLTQSIGVGSSPLTWLKTKLGFALQETFASEQTGFADDEETPNKIETLKVEPGLESVTNIDLRLNDMVKYAGTLTIFANFKGQDQIDGKFENLLSIELAKYVNVSFAYDLLYDKDLNESYQERQVLSAGFNYSLF